MSKELYYHSDPYYTKKKTKFPCRITICGILSDDGDLVLGLSRCSGKDNFTKKIGRLIARGRASTKPIKEYYLKVKEGRFEEPPVHQFIHYAEELIKEIEPIRNKIK